MIVEIIAKGGIGRSNPVVIDATQVVVRQRNGTPICVAAEYGPDGAQAVSHAGDEEFNRVLHALGIDDLVICEPINMSPLPHGAKKLQML